uniref:Uncharacterized protein n=1 Tax=Romanomermis culicivorax TaxID=13658 RepID=A0A915JMS4_ROMCU
MFTMGDCNAGFCCLAASCKAWRCSSDNNRTCTFMASGVKVKMEPSLPDGCHQVCNLKLYIGSAWWTF